MLIAAFGSPGPAGRAQSVTILLVTTTADDNDSNPNDGICSTGGRNPQCTLRAAIQTANQSSGDARILLGSGTYALALSGEDDQAARGDLDVTSVVEIVVNPGQPGPVTIDAGTNDNPIFETHGGAALSLTGVALIGRNDAALRLAAGSARLSAVTITGQGAVWAIRQQAGDLTLENSTVTGNGRGGVRVEAGNALLNGVTIAANGQDQQADSAGLASVGSATVTVRNTILANNRSVDCAGSKTWSGANLVETHDSACVVTSGVLSQDPQLLALANNGGPTRTQAPALGSPALNAGGACDLTRDQRGVGRPQGGACDLGALEYPIARLAQSAWATDDVAGQVPIGVRLDRAALIPLEVVVATSNGSAQAGVDYVALAAVVNFPAGVTEVTSTVTILDRPQATGAVTLTVTVGPGTGPAVVPGAPESGVITIDDTSAPDVSAQFQTPNTTVAAGAPAQLQVTLGEAPVLTSTVNFATVAGSAQAGVDFTPTSGSLVFAPGQTAATLTVQTLANPAAPQTLQFSVILTAGSGTIAVPPTTAIVTLTRPGSQALRLPGILRSFSAVREREPNNTTGTATGPVVAGTTFLGAYEGGTTLDTDVWYFDVDGPQSATVTVTGLDAGGQVWLRHANGTQLGFAGAAPFTITAALPEAGRYFIGVVSTSQLGAAEYQLRLSLP
jgi:CSLREA domain-containing protein